MSVHLFQNYFLPLDATKSCTPDLSMPSYSVLKCELQANL